MTRRRRRKFTVKEAMLARARKHRKKAFPHAVIGLAVSFLILMVASLWPQAEPQALETASEDDSVFTASFVGDIMTGRYVEQVMDHRGSDFIFQHARPYFEEADYVTGNFENPVLLEEKEYVPADKEIHLQAGEASVDMLEHAGFSVLNLANNHMLDYGQEGLEDTLTVFENSGLDTAGAYTDRLDEQMVSYQQYDGLVVATLGVNDVWSASGRLGLVESNPSQALPMIEEASREADLVVVHVHSGVEYTSTPTERQEVLMKAYVDAGADIVVGTHPHVLQSVEVYEDGIIFYSLGNFVFDQGWTRTRDTILAQYELKSDGIAEIELVPFRVYESQPRPLSGIAQGYFRERIYQQLTKDTTDSDVYERRGDRLVFTVDHSHVLD